MARTSFTKYQERGAYHWREASLHPFHSWPYTRSRINWVVHQCAHSRAILEIGCGDGAILGRLAKLGKTVVGVDAEPSALEAARDMFARRGLAGTFYKDLGAIQGQRFDAVILAEVLEHVEDPHSLLKTIAQFMSPEAVFVMTTPVRLLERPLDLHHVHELWPQELEVLLGKYFEDVRLNLMHPAWFVDLLCYGIGGVRPVAVLSNLIRLLGIELIDVLPSPLSIYWTQGAVCRRPR